LFFVDTINGKSIKAIAIIMQIAIKKTSVIRMIKGGAKLPL